MPVLILCLKIFFVRIIDVSLATIATLYTVNNKKITATILGFIDVIIWFVIVREAINTNLNNIFIPISYAGGYAIGTFLGASISDIMINKTMSVQVILNKLPKTKINILRKNNYAVTEINCIGNKNTKKTMLFIEINKKRLKELKNIIYEIDNKAFIVVNESKIVENGYIR